jgi:hypothetical protein
MEVWSQWGGRVLADSLTGSRWIDAVDWARGKFESTRDWWTSLESVPSNWGDLRGPRASIVARIWALDWAQLWKQLERESGVFADASAQEDHPKERGTHRRQRRTKERINSLLSEWFAERTYLQKWWSVALCAGFLLGIASAGVARIFVSATLTMLGNVAFRRAGLRTLKAGRWTLFHPAVRFCIDTITWCGLIAGSPVVVSWLLLCRMPERMARLLNRLLPIVSSQIGLFGLLTMMIPIATGQDQPAQQPEPAAAGQEEILKQVAAEAIRQYLESQKKLAEMTANATTNNATVENVTKTLNATNATSFDAAKAADEAIEKMISATESILKFLIAAVTWFVDWFVFIINIVISIWTRITQNVGWNLRTAGVLILIIICVVFFRFFWRTLVGVIRWTHRNTLRRMLNAIPPIPVASRITNWIKQIWEMGATGETETLSLQESRKLSPLDPRFLQSIRTVEANLADTNITFQHLDRAKLINGMVGMLSRRRRIIGKLKLTKPTTPNR